MTYTLFVRIQALIKDGLLSSPISTSLNWNHTVMGWVVSLKAYNLSSIQTVDGCTIRSPSHYSICGLPVGWRISRHRSCELSPGELWRLTMLKDSNQYDRN